MIAKALFGAWLLLAPLMIAAPTDAALVAADGWVSGDKRLTTDTATGLTWLDLRLTAGRSFADMFVNDVSGLIALGFRAPTLAEVEALLEHAGAPPASFPGTGVFDPALFAPAKAFIDLFGCTSCGDPLVAPRFSQGFVISPTNGARLGSAEIVTHTGRFSLGLDGFGFGTPTGQTYHQANAGFFLAIETASIDGLFLGPPPEPGFVPEPGTLILLAFGIAGLAGLTRTRLRSQVSSPAPPTKFPPARSGSGGSPRGSGASAMDCRLSRARRA